MGNRKISLGIGITEIQNEVPYMNSLIVVASKACIISYLFISIMNLTKKRKNLDTLCDLCSLSSLPSDKNERSGAWGAGVWVAGVFLDRFEGLRSTGVKSGCLRLAARVLGAVVGASISCTSSSSLSTNSSPSAGGVGSSSFTVLVIASVALCFDWRV